MKEIQDITLAEYQTIAEHRTNLEGWVCTKCRRYWGKEERLARYCCTSRSLCECGELTELHSTKCSPCRRKAEADREAERFAKAEKVTEWDGPVCVESCAGPNDGYFRNVQEFEEHLETEHDDDWEQHKPAYVWTCRSTPIVSGSFDSVLERAGEDAWDEWSPDDLDGLAEFRAACEAFEKANADQVRWDIDYSRALVL